MNLDSSNTSQSVMELKSDKDVLWFLNMARKVTDASCPLIVSKFMPREGSSTNSVARNISLGEYCVEDSPKTIAMFENINLGKLPPNFDVGVNYIYAKMFDLQKVIAMVAIKNNF